MTTARRVLLVFALFLVVPLFKTCEALTAMVCRAWLRPFPSVLAAAPHLLESLGLLVWLAVACLPLFVWPSWRDLGSWRLRWSWTVLAPLPSLLDNLSGFGGWPAAHPCVGTMDVLAQTLLIAASEEIVFRGYMFHDRPWLRPRVTVLASSLAFALLHYVNLGQGTWQMVSRQVGFAFFMGLNLGTIRLATGSLGWCILLHWAIDAADGFWGHGSESDLLLNTVVNPGWMLLSVLLLCAHPALRPPLAVVDQTTPPPSPPAAKLASRGRLARRTAVVLLGAAAGLVLLLALSFLLAPRSDPAQGRAIAASLIGRFVLPAALLAVSAACWPRWRALAPAPALDAALRAQTSAPIELAAVKPGATLLCFVSSMTTLSMALYTALDFTANSSLLHTASWSTLWQIAWRLGGLALGLLSAPALLWFSLCLAIQPRSSWRTLLGWSYATAFYGGFLWFTVTCLHIRLEVAVVLRLDVWHVAALGLLVALWLAARDLRQLWRARPQAGPGASLRRGTHCPTTRS